MTNANRGVYFCNNIILLNFGANEILMERFNCKFSTVDDVLLVVYITIFGGLTKWINIMLFFYKQVTFRRFHNFLLCNLDLIILIGR